MGKLIQLILFKEIYFIQQFALHLLNTKFIKNRLLFMKDEYKELLLCSNTFEYISNQFRFLNICY